MDRWLIADLHLNHARVVDEGDRPAGFEALVQANWRRLVGPSDWVYVLGDVIFRRAGELPMWLAAVPGVKVLVRGNHDLERSAWYLRRGFAFVADAIEHKDVLLTHEPRVPLPEHVRVNVHGHFHAPDTGGHPVSHYEYRRAPYEPYYSHHESRYRLVALEPTYAPLRWEDVVA